MYTYCYKSNYLGWWQRGFCWDDLKYHLFDDSSRRKSFCVQPARWHSRFTTFFQVYLHVVAPQPRTHQPAVALHSGPFSHSQLTSSLVALKVLGSTDSTLMGFSYMEGRLLRAPLQCVMMLVVLPCSQEEQPNLKGRLKDWIFAGLWIKGIVILLILILSFSP